jgi:hypothetical protein
LHGCHWRALWGTGKCSLVQTISRHLSLVVLSLGLRCSERFTGELARKNDASNSNENSMNKSAFPLRKVVA